MTGLFFGSFNPIHNGHLNIAHYLLDRGYCEEIWFIISPRNPFKQDVSLLPEEKRFEIVRAAIRNEKNIKACDIEFSMPRPSYTIDSLKRFNELYPDKKFALIMGADNLKDFHLWKEYQTIAENYRILVYPRPGINITHITYPDVIHVDAPLSTLSSTEIREKIKQGEAIATDVPAAAAELIKAAYHETINQHYLEE